MLRMSPEEYQRLQSRFQPGAAPAAKKTERKAAKRRNKYGAERTAVDGIEFDSKAEAKRYMQLKAMEQRGEISDLKLQVVFELLPAQEINGHKERPMTYVADFTYLDSNGELVVEDVKSAITKTRTFLDKKKLMLFFHKIVIREVTEP